jgi:hypothetical protein
MAQLIPAQKTRNDVLHVAGQLAKSQEHRQCDLISDGDCKRMEGGRGYPASWVCLSGSYKGEYVGVRCHAAASHVFKNGLLVAKPSPSGDMYGGSLLP